MSSSSFPVDPYRPPAEIVAEPVRRVLPVGLAVICIIAIILGVIGLITGAIQVATLTVGKQFQQMMQGTNQRGLSPQQVEVQKQMQDELNAINDQLLVPSAIKAVVHLAVATLLVVGGIMSLLMKPSGRIVLLGVCALALFYEAGHTVLDTMVQMKVITVMETYFPKLLSLGPQGPGQAQAEDALKVGMKIGMVIGLVFAFTMVFIKVVFYCITLFYLNRPRIKSLFAAPILAT